jgi:uncharacterized protein (DUF305 family)
MASRNYVSWRAAPLAGVIALALALPAKSQETIGAAGDVATQHSETQHHIGHGGVASPNSPAKASSDSTFYGEMDEVNARMHEAMQVQPSGDFDRDFARMMIPHHQGAIDMAVVLLKYGRDERLKRLAQSIIVEQAEEIAYMRSLLGAAPGELSPGNPDER